MSLTHFGHPMCSASVTAPCALHLSQPRVSPHLSQPHCFPHLSTRHSLLFQVKDGVCKNDLRVDKGKTRLLYLPGVAAGLILSCELSFWTLHLDPIFSLLLAAIPSYFFGKYFTENIFAQKPLVTTAPCPECGSLMTVYFGDLLSVQTDGIIGAPTPPQDEVMCKCGNCKSDLKADRTRMIIETLPNPAKVAV